MHSAIEGVLNTLRSVAEASRRRLDVAIDGRVAHSVLTPVLASGLVRRVVEHGEPADLGIVWLEEQDLARFGYLCPNAVVLYDPKRVAPVQANRAARCAWADTQSWVLPLDGERAFTEGLVIASAWYQSDMPRISCSMPVNMEENDVERVLASFLPVCQEWVVGVDEKSTDGTLEVVRRYAEKVFRFRVEPWSFAAARNLGLDRCSYPWVFETEGHEHLDHESLPAIRELGAIRLPRGVLMVGRDTGGGDPNKGEFFYFPWIFRNHPALRFSDQGGVHNALEMDDFSRAVGTDEPVAMRIPATLRTIHKPHPKNRAVRNAQREAMNRQALDGYVEAGGARKSRALFYSSQEHASSGDLRTAIRKTVEYLRTGDRFHEQAFEAHLRLAEYLLDLKKPRLAIPILKRALPLDVHRVEAYVVLGDAFLILKEWDSARQCFAKAAGVPMPNYANLFLRKPYYRGYPWRGLALACTQLGDFGGAAQAAKNALQFDPSDKDAKAILAQCEPEVVRSA